MIYMCEKCKAEAHPGACVSGEAVFMSVMLGQTKAMTIRGLIEHLLVLEEAKGETAMVAWTVYTENDIVEDCEDFDVPSVTEAWEAIADSIQDDLTEGFFVERFADNIRDALSDAFPARD
ncbi:hypothetical protein UFOVP221_34 [uncultured Caudovirales phage]|uniref:Uncharacterized protein n=1 Tax=uncultured Caudovirales phage TaxID=2100421 RepID=A0A6J7WMX4_9CAUD|nr:hypothetical protein UFOVP221_34 [uncultured Caudovirales phage]